MNALTVTIENVLFNYFELSFYAFVYADVIWELAKTDHYFVSFFRYILIIFVFLSFSVAVFFNLICSLSKDDYLLIKKCGFHIPELHAHIYINKIDKGSFGHN